ncbi:Tctex1 domain-containing protein 1 [Mactra antiquata]
MSYRYKPTESCAESYTEHLTVQALKAHDKWSASKRSHGSWSLDSKTSDSVLSKHASESSRRSTSNNPSDNQASKKQQRNTERPRSKINPFKLIMRTRAWHKQARQSGRLRREMMKYLEFENTFKTEPDPGRYFDVFKVTAILRYSLEQRLAYVKYSPAQCSVLSMELSEKIKHEVKFITSPRYKIICLVLIGEYKKQGIQVSSRCLWNVNTDNYASFTYTNRSLFAVANVYGLYYE